MRTILLIMRISVRILFSPRIKNLLSDSVIFNVSHITKGNHDYNMQSKSSGFYKICKKTESVIP